MFKNIKTRVRKVQHEGYLGKFTRCFLSVRKCHFSVNSFHVLSMQRSVLWPSIVGVTPMANESAESIFYQPVVSLSSACRQLVVCPSRRPKN